MLVELSIRNLALFEAAEFCFGEGLNVITGETGAGKSLALGALELLLGQRPRTKLVRSGEAEARVDGRFVFAADAAPPALLAELRASAPECLADLADGDALELVLSRTLGADGRTRAHLNGRPVTQRFLRELAGRLVEIHGQNDHQRLLDVEEQLRLLDAFGGLGPRRETYQGARERWLEAGRALAEWESREAARRDRVDLLRFQARELAEAELDAAEIDELRRERERLRHGEELAVQLGGALGALAEEEGAALDVLRRAESLLDRWEAKVSELAAPASDLRDATAHLEEAAAALRSFLDGLEFSPRRLEEVEARLDEIDRLERKYRRDVPALVALLPELEAELGELEAQARGLEACAAELRAARAALDDAAGALTRGRQRLRARLAKAVEGALAELGLERARFEVRLEPREAAALRSPNADAAKAAREAETRRFGPDGADAVEFLLAANPGEGPAPLRKVASGGEAARIMLALRGALAAKQTIPTLVFDEVDAGVGGRLAPKVGAHLRALAEHYQIFCITHLPAVAAAAHRHLEVHKRVEGERTFTRVRELAGDDRVAVIAEMIAGGGEQETARAEAKRLLRAP
ncbi:MAG: DNA repair protein RecN [Planctomycetes bacterium]|nr:DNA repair protein RecN [Planctomycetota bacterium]